MSGKLVLDFELAEDIVRLDSGTIYVSLGNGVNLKTTVPNWVARINSASLTLTLDIEGEPPDAQPSTTPVERVHETPTDRGLEVRKNGSAGEPGSEV